METDIEFLEHTFDQMKEVGLIETKAAFSQVILGKGASYLTSMSARDRIVPMEVFDHVSLRLFDRAQQANAAIAAMEAELCLAIKRASQEAAIRDAFEEHRCRRLAEELSGVHDADVDDEPAPATSSFVQTVLRKTGLAKVAMVGRRAAQDRTLH